MAAIVQPSFRGFSLSPLDTSGADDALDQLAAIPQVHKFYREFFRVDSSKFYCLLAKGVEIEDATETAALKFLREWYDEP